MPETSWVGANSRTFGPDQTGGPSTTAQIDLDAVTDEVDACLGGERVDESDRGQFRVLVTTLVGTGSDSTMTPTSRWAKPGRPLPQAMQKSGLVYATPSYEVAPLNG